MALSWISITLIAVLLAYAYSRNRTRAHSSLTRWAAETETPGHLERDPSLPQSARQLRAKLLAALPHIVITPDSHVDFQSAIHPSWDEKSCEPVPACVIRPRNVWELASAVKILRREFHLRRHDTKARSASIFAIKSRGHYPVSGASSMENGVLIDLTLFNQVTPSADGQNAVIGMGCKWADVYTQLYTQGLAVVGGQNSAQGVGGLLLGGGVSFSTPRFGFACSNIIEYELVLADGTVTKASETLNPEIFRALKGGGNHFGIVTTVTVVCFPATDVWGGFRYFPSFESSRTITAFHDFVSKAVSKDKGPSYDSNAAGPMIRFGYLPKFGIQTIALHLVHTAPLRSDTKSPAWYLNSGFAKLWPIWSTCTVRSMIDLTNEIAKSDPPGRHQEFATTTIKNDLATLYAAHKAYTTALSSIRKHNLKPQSYTLTLQPILPSWLHKRDPKPLGLSTDNPLVTLTFSLACAQRIHDNTVVQRILRSAIQDVEVFAQRNNTAHPYRTLEDYAAWQDPFAGYMEEEMAVVRETSARVDPDGMFQWGCAGGFTLGKGH